MIYDAPPKEDVERDSQDGLLDMIPWNSYSSLISGEKSPNISKITKSLIKFYNIYIIVSN